MSTRSVVSRHSDADQRKHLSRAQYHARKNRVFQHTFHLGKQEVLLDDCACAIQQTILIQGRIYISKNYICFYSNLFFRTEIVIKVETVTGLERASVAVVVKNSIKIHTKEKSYFFASFANRDEVFTLLLKLCGADKEIMGQSKSDGDSKGKPETQTEPEADKSSPPTTDDAPEGGIQLSPYVPVSDISFTSCIPPATPIIPDDQRPLKQALEIYTTTLPINTGQFYLLFLQDRAPYGFYEFNTLRGDKDISLSTWKLEKDGPMQLYTRRMVLVADLRGQSFGPDSATVYTQQRLLRSGSLSAGRMELESVVSTPGVMVGDCFSVAVTYTLEDKPDGTCNLRTAMDVCFLKSSWKLTPIKATIVSIAGQKNKEAIPQWGDIIKKWLADHPISARLAADEVEKHRAAGPKFATVEEAPLSSAPPPASSPANRISTRRFDLPSVSVHFSALCAVATAMVFAWLVMDFVTLDGLGVSAEAVWRLTAFSLVLLTGMGMHCNGQRWNCVIRTLDEARELTLRHDNLLKEVLADMQSIRATGMARLNQNLDEHHF